MPEFNDPQQVEQIAYEMKLADWPRGQNRARINELFNGWPPFTTEEVQRNNIAVNVNFLEPTTIAHDARSQFSGAFMKPGNFFRASTDMGTKHKRVERGAVVTRAINKRMKRSLDYYECFRSKFANNVLHGIGPAVWTDDDLWCPDPMGIEDVLIPGKTYLTMKNLPLFFIYHSFTAPELIRLTRGPNPDPGWQMDLVQSAIEWIDQETLQLLGSTWPEVWSPEKLAERVKGDGGFYPGDTAPTLDCFDFYFWCDDGEDSGWRRRIILDSWGAPQAAGSGWRMDRRGGKLHENRKNGFLYTSGKRNVAPKWQNLMNFQFADLSASAPFQYHSVRGLGFLLYGVCHLQNRLRCKFTESVFEALLNYFRIKSADDMQRALKVELANRGFIDDSVEFVKAGDRWQINSNLVELGLQQNEGLINRHSASFNANALGQDKTEKTAAQYVGEIQSTTQLVSTALGQAYRYQAFEYYEIVRRFMRRNSKDPDVIAAQAEMLSHDVPEEMLIPEAWECEPEQVMGGGNMALETAIANWLMANRDKYEPDGQREILRRATFAVTGDPGFTDLVVPEEDVVSNSVHDAQIAAAGMMLGLPMALKQGVNHQEYAQALMAAMVQQIQKITQRDNVSTMDELEGLQNLAGQTVQGAPVQGNGVRNHIAVLQGDPGAKETVKELSQQLGRLMNLVKAFAQRLMEKQQSVQAAQPQMDPKDQAKLQAQQAEDAQKLKNMRESHAQRTAQRQLQFEQQIKQDQQRHAAEMGKLATETVHSVGRKQFAALTE